MRVLAGCIAVSLALFSSCACFTGAGVVTYLFLIPGDGGDVAKPLVNPGIVRPATPKISVEVPPHLDYTGIINRLVIWKGETTDLTEYGKYGASRGGKELVFLRVGNLHTRNRIPVLVTACIHGNEPLSTSTVMGYIGRLLSRYGKDAEVTRLLDTRDIYFVPVVSPDSYPHSRQVDGVDPNRDFPGPHDPQRKSTPSIAALQSLFLKIKPKAAWSGHTSGRLFMTSYGDSTQRIPEETQYAALYGRMAQLANYRWIHACEMYGHPIKGSEVDWYYRNGACSVVCEYGTIQRPATPAEIKEELDRTWPAFLLWLDKAPTLLSSPSDNSAHEALEEVNAVRAKKGLPAFFRDEGLTQGALAVAAYRAAHQIKGHVQEGREKTDSSFLPAGVKADAAGCAAWPEKDGWGSCCTFDRQWKYAGAAWAKGKNGLRYMDLFVRK